jgi:pimeloyl-ACP methyl ester carboxylesterase
MGHYHFRFSLRRRMLFVSVTTMLAVSSLFMATADAASNKQTASPGCRLQMLKVTLTPGGANDQTVSGTLCTPSYWTGRTHAVDVLMHGATYNSAYWNFPTKYPEYSYVSQTLLAGRATFAYDAIGAGKSSHPTSSSITPQVAAYVSHQVVQWLWAQKTYGKVDLIGHSMGSMMAIGEAATYHDVSAVVATGELHNISASGIAFLQSSVVSASADPQFSALKLDPGYVTTAPGTRGARFYSSIANKTVIAYDEAHKDTISGLEIGQGNAQLAAPAATNISQGVTAPILEMVGDQDRLFCVGSPVDCDNHAAVQANEMTYFTHARSVTTEVIPATGHDIALHPTNLLAFAEINYWLNTH